MTKAVYIDEAGTDAGSPVTVVTGIFVDLDSQWEDVTRYLEAVRNKLPEAHRDGFVFHAKDIYSGGKTLPRANYDKDVRFPIVEELLAGPRRIGLPIAFAYQWIHPPEQKWNPKNEIFVRHLTTFHEAVKKINAMMKKEFPYERAILIAEDVPERRKFLAGTMDILRDKSAPEFMTGPVEFDAIVDGINFSAKNGAPFLQFADAAAFAIRHYLSNHKDGPWAAQHLFGRTDLEPMFANGRANAGASSGVRWRPPHRPPL